MSKLIMLGIGLTDNLTIKKVWFEINETDLPDDHRTIELVANGLLKSVEANRGELLVKELIESTLPPEASNE